MKNMSELQEKNLYNFGNSTSFDYQEHDEVTLWEVIRNFVPNVANTFLYFFINLIETHFLGKTKDLDLFNGVSLGSTYNLFFLIVANGFTDTLTIILPKNFALKKWDVIGRLTNQSRTIVFAYYLIYIVLTLSLSSNILYYLGGEDSSYILIANKFVIYTLPQIFLESQSDILIKYSESHMYYTPVLVSIILSGTTHLLGSFLLISHYNLGVVGSALATNLTYSVKLIYLLIHLRFLNPYQESFRWYDKSFFEDFGSTLKLSLITMISAFSQYNFTTISQIVANKTSKISYAKHIVLYNITSIFFSITYGNMSTICILVSNYIGKNSVKNIKKSIYYLAIIAAASFCILATIFYFLRHHFYFFFNQSYDVYNYPDMGGKLTFYLIIENLLDLIETFLMAILRTCEVYDSMILFLFLMQMIFHGFNLTFSTLILNFGLDGIYFSDCLNWICLISFWSIYITYKLDFQEVCNNNAKNEMALEIQDESSKLLNHSIDDTFGESI
jgi:Na+-driven multidrug efflux pump